MKVDFRALREENIRRYGTDVAEWAQDLLADLYSEKTHFLYELLQNAEDAIGRRNSSGPTTVSFKLLPCGLEVTHYGKPFDENDVRGICGISKSTKKRELTAIGRFGIGFKSVYSVTARPEIRSAEQSFAIESYVLPVELPSDDARQAGTRFWLPMEHIDDSERAEIADGLSHFDWTSLLFLRNVSGIDWHIQGVTEGSYRRIEKELEPAIRIVSLFAFEKPHVDYEEESQHEERWLVFSRPVFREGIQVGFAELAFGCDANLGSDELRIRSVTDSRLVSYFPTGIHTNLGFLVQAPFRTTPARDNIPHKDSWNQHLLSELSMLLVESLQKLKERGLLTIDVLNGMPLNEDKFVEGTMFRPFYDEFHKALQTHKFLPTSKGKYISARNAVLARGQGLTKLLDSKQLTSLFDSADRLEWLSDQITSDRTPELRSYLNVKQNVREVQPQAFVSRINVEFLEEQSDAWTAKLYEFLAGQSALWKTPGNVNRPWVRLEDGSHVTAYSGDQPNAFLPSKAATGFPTVRRSVCGSEDGLAFLKNTLRLTEPDIVDGVIKNILPQYADGAESNDFTIYREHLRAIESAYENRNTREKLISALKQKRWVLAVDNEGNRDWLTPFQCYLPTERLKQLFEGVPHIFFVDDSDEGLRGEIMRGILIACGAARYLDPVEPKAGLSIAEKLALRKKTGEPGCTGGEVENDRTLYGLDRILKRISELPHDQACERSRMLWESLADVVQDKREGVVKATYSWFYYTAKSQDFEAAFIRELREAKWIPTKTGRLAPPDEVVFEDIEPVWEPNVVLQSALKFRQSALVELAEMMGIDVNVLSRIKKSGLTAEEVLQKLGLSDSGVDDQDDGEEANLDPEVDKRDQQDGGGQSASRERDSVGASDRNAGLRTGAGSGSQGGIERSEPYSPGQARRANSQAGRREFVSFLKTHPVEVVDDEFSDSASHEERMRVEGVAIERILVLEPALHRTPAGNKGFDLYEAGENGKPKRWIEVKAMVGTLANHPVGMSKAQFEMAQEKRTRFWLYIVESTTSKEPRILKIQDPAGNARTFTFDEGWREIAMVCQVNIETGEVKV